MHLDQGRHPIGQAVLDHSDLHRNASMNRPMPVEVLLELVTNDEGISGDVSRLVGEAFVQAGAQPDISSASVGFLQEGEFTYVLVADSADVSQPLVMQVAKGSQEKYEGQTVERDYRNLRILEQQLAANLTPRTFGHGIITLTPELANVPVIFTEYLEGYSEINQRGNWLGMLGDCYTNVPQHLSRKFDHNESKQIIRGMVRVLSEIYFGTYDPTKGQGLLVSDVDIERGDFVWRSFEDENQPPIKLVTVRELDAATPDELITSVLSPGRRESALLMGPPPRLHAAGDGNSIQTAAQGLYDGIRSLVPPAQARRFTQDIFSTYEQIATTRAETIFDDIQRKRIWKFDQIPSGYRNLIRNMSIIEESHRDRNKQIIEVGRAATEKRAFKNVRRVRDKVLETIREYGTELSSVDVTAFVQ
ncbi:MAG: hypothetical protein WBO77_01180 [Microgenomates group bacterium]